MQSNQRQASLFTSLDTAHKLLSDCFEPSTDTVIRRIKDQSTGSAGLLVYIDGLVKADRLEDHVLKTLLKGNESAAETILQFEKEDVFEHIIKVIVLGKAVLFIEGKSFAYVLSVPDGPKRGIEEPPTEAVIRGPREGFTERLSANLALIRYKIKDPNLKFEKLEIGRLTKTQVVLGYIQGLAKASVIHEVRKRLSKIEIDSVMESGYIEEFIEDYPRSPFPQLQNSERPDTIAGQLLEGRFAIFVDGTPFVLSGPVTFWSMMRAPEDYYERALYTTPIVWLRYLLVFLAFFLPSLYIATTTYHHDLLPTSLVLSIAAARESIPFPVLIEALIMEISFEALREAGIRLPKAVGQSVSILGALVIGQAAVEAGIVSAPMVIVVSMTGIASFTIPRFNFAIGIRLLRFPLMFLAGLFGLYGIIIGTLLVATHLCTLSSFGVPYLSGIAPLRKKDLKDIAIRSPWYRMVRRPSFAANDGLSRVKERNKQRRRDK